MEELKLFEAEYKFMTILWAHAPIKSTKLVKICAEELGWKKSTTYTTIKRLSQRRIVENKDAVVTYLITKDTLRQSESEEHLSKLYEGSIKMFLASFLSKETLTEEEAGELKRLIDQKLKGDL